MPSPSTAVRSSAPAHDAHIPRITRSLSCDEQTVRNAIHAVKWKGVAAPTNRSCRVHTDRTAFLYLISGCDSPPRSRPCEAVREPRASRPPRWTARTAARAREPASQEGANNNRRRGRWAHPRSMSASMSPRITSTFARARPGIGGGSRTTRRDLPHWSRAWPSWHRRCTRTRVPGWRPPAGTSGRRPPPSPPPPSRSPWSIRARCATSPGPRGGWRRRTPSTPRSSRASPRRSARRRARRRPQGHRSWRGCSRGGGSSWR